jgi:hypothetical protein
MNEIHNYSELYPIAAHNPELRDKLYNNFAHELNTLFGPDAWTKGAVKLFDKSVSKVGDKFVVISPDGKPISYHPDAESALKALLVVNEAESGISKSVKQIGDKWAVVDTDGKVLEYCPDKASANAADARIKVGKMIKAEVEEWMTFEPTEIEKSASEEFVKTSGKVNANGEFKDGFDGCVTHMQSSKHLPADRAKKLCAYIGRNAGKIKKDSEPVADESTGKKPSISVKKNDDGTVNWEIEFPIYKLDNEKRLVGGVVYEPDVVDAQHDSASEAEIEKAAHNFIEQSRTLGIMHKEEAGPRAKIVESYVAPTNMKIGNQNIRKGTWMMVVKVYDNELWNLVKDGKITGFSMGGRAREEKA